MSDIRVVFMGTPVFACTVLQTLIDEKYNIVAAVTQPDKPVGRHHEIAKTPVHELAEKYGIPAVQPEHLREQYDQVLAYEPELIVTCAYGQWVPNEILNYPKYGCVNIHPSLLPKYRGGAPVHHAVWAGDEETGVCLMEMAEKMDAGKIYAVEKVPIGPDDTTYDLNQKLMPASAKLIREKLPEYLAGNLPGTEQDERFYTIARNISKDQEHVCFGRVNVHEAYNHVRALIDWPIPYGVIEGKRIRIYKARMQEGLPEGIIPGTLIGFREGAMEIACLDGIIKVYELQPEGKKRMKAADFANGAGRNLIGKVFD